MCWSGEASGVLATVGFAGAYFSRRKGHERSRWLPLVYFSCMELLQALTYIVIGQCWNSTNMMLTNASYVHIAFQPFFANMFGLSWLGPEARKKARWIWPLCALTTLVMLLMLVFPTWPGHCDPVSQPVCGLDTCAYRGDWHIAWRLSLSRLDAYYLCYLLVVFVAPIIYGKWRWALYHALLGPVLAFFLSSNKDERPAVWCLMSIAFLSATHIPFLSRWMSGGNNKPSGPSRGLAM